MYLPAFGRVGDVRRTELVVQCVTQRRAPEAGCGRFAVASHSRIGDSARTYISCCAVARRRFPLAATPADGKRLLLPQPAGAAGGPLPITASRMGWLLDALLRAYDVLGFGPL
jgi:hypothetical protein